MSKAICDPGMGRAGADVKGNIALIDFMDPTDKKHATAVLDMMDEVLCQ